MVEKSSSYREESNFPYDLKKFEKKALNDLKSKLEEAILGNKLFKKEVAKEAPKESPKKEGEMKHTRSRWPLCFLHSIQMPCLKFWCIGSSRQILLLHVKIAPSNLYSVSQPDSIDNNHDSRLHQIYGVMTLLFLSGNQQILDDEELYKKTFGTEEKRIQFLRWRVQLMEKGIQKLDFKPGGVNSLLQINDPKNSPEPSRKEVPVATKQVVLLLQDNYPEFAAKNMLLSFCVFFSMNV
ncbi:uncharacterized protein [Coffea arabica]|uniref:Uncharacterized protein n=1 Tax=Coffea arabica TaxID=13443 RepID=A0ABM4W7B4_COFAR